MHRAPTLDKFEASRRTRSTCVRRHGLPIKGSISLDPSPPPGEGRAGWASAGSEPLAVLAVLDDAAYDFILAAGDDATDEDMFQALPKEAATIRVGIRPTSAHYLVARQQDIGDLLWKLTELSRK